ncbi:MAG: N-acetyl-gamma-glutamyl-phosphate reductase [Beijerinckiaceae bacterium]
MNEMPSPRMFKLKGDKPAIFIDGEAGTTGLQIRERLVGMASIQLLSIDPALRKDAAARKAMMRQADLIILCLHDDHAREAVSMAAELGADAPRILDASTAHRVAEGWVYGFAELAPGLADAVRKAQRVSNPGCYSTGAIALLRPLIDAGLVPAEHPLSINAVSGYSGGGRSLIEAHEAGSAPPFELYGLGLAHKHIPETMRYTGLTTRPIFVPSVANFAQGMLVSIPLHLDMLPAKPTGTNLLMAFQKHYAGSEYVKVISAETLASEGGKITPEDLNGSNALEIRVYSSEPQRQVVLVARLDNLGKGASGAAVQNLKLMLGL